MLDIILACCLSTDLMFLSHERLESLSFAFRRLALESGGTYKLQEIRDQENWRIEEAVRMTDSNRKAFDELLAENEEFRKLGPHERFLILRERESWQGTSSVALASLLHDVRTVERSIFKGDSPDSRGPEGVTCLMYAAEYGDLELLKFLLNKGATVDLRDESGMTALYHAALHGRHQAVELLLTLGANPNITPSDRRTLLHVAVASGNHETIEFVLKMRPVVDAQSESGITPLILATMNRDSSIVKLLLDSGANPNISDSEGTTPLIVATTDDEAFLPANSECVRLLLAHGALANAQDGKGWTPLMGASLYGELEVVRELVASGADSSMTDTQGRSALGLAKQARKQDIVAYLAGLSSR